MSLIQLPSEIRKLFSASSVISFAQAVEELVYNAIDAKATSIAVRVHIGDGFIQVVDNGHGLSGSNIKTLGQAYSTNKYHISALNTVPEYYGFRGQTIANLIKISRQVKITTCCSLNKDTWTKTFVEGKEHFLGQAKARPSTGTTVDIKGFMYNLQIRKKSIQEINELNKIKSFLEKLSLVHYNISLSLRDNSRNEITLKALKNSDIYQTLFSLCGVEKQNIQEFQIEKNDYRIKAFLTDKNNDYNWIYLNNRFVSNKRIKNYINNEIKKYSNNVRGINKKQQKHFNEEILDAGLPSYFVFISCPYGEYDYSNTPTQSLLEFKNWDFIKKLLNKLIKFYFGKLDVKELHKSKTEGNKGQEDTKDQVKRIIDRVLGSKRAKISQVQKGMKGKFAKRKIEKKSKKTSDINGLKEDINNLKKTSYLDLNKLETSPKTRLKISLKLKQKPDNKKPMLLAEPQKLIKKQKNRKRLVNDNTIYKFQNKNSTVQNRCNELAKKVSYVLPSIQDKQDIVINHTVQYSNIVKENKQYTIKKHVEEITIQTTKYKKSLYCNQLSTNIDSIEKGIQNLRNTDYYPNINSRQLIFNKLHHSGSDQDLISREKLTYYSHMKSPFQTFKSHRANNLIDNISRSRYKYTRNFISKKETFIEDHGQTVVGVERPKGKRKPGNHFDSVMETSNDVKSINTNTVDGFKVIDTYQLIKHNIYDIQPFSTEITNTPSRSVAKLFDPESQMHIVNGVDNHPSGNTYNKTIHSILSSEHRPLRTFLLENDLTHNGGQRKFKEVNEISFEELSNRYFQFSTFSNEFNKKYFMSPRNTYTLSSPIFVKDTNDKINFIPSRQNNELDISKMNSRNFEYSFIFISKSQTLEPNKAHNMNAAPFEFQGELENISVSATDKIHNKSTLAELSVQINLDELIHKLHSMVITTEREKQSHIELTFNKVSNDCIEKRNAHFTINDRCSFIPKGMSPKNRLKANFHNQCEQESVFFTNEIYDEFVNDVQINTKIYEPNVKHMNEFGTKDINKFKSKISKNNAPLNFDCHSLRKAKVLGQVDNKFIAAKLLGKCYHSKEAAEFLVLFDQHAIHERIRLERKLLNDYLHEDRWADVKIDNITLKFTKEELLYISNYSDKFKQFGLHWTIMNDQELKVHTIPEAIFGKNPREVDKIIIAVRKLFLELVDSIQSQRGAIPLYPKSIMELVFSEACRYAIKFGDKLSLKTCSDLILELSDCMVPFQCAHGRPVVAVLLEMETIASDDYSMNLSKVLQWKKKFLNKYLG